MSCEVVVPGFFLFHEGLIVSSACTPLPPRRTLSPSVECRRLPGSRSRWSAAAGWTPCGVRRRLPAAARTKIRSRLGAYRAPLSIPRSVCLAGSSERKGQATSSPLLRRWDCVCSKSRALAALRAHLPGDSGVWAWRSPHCSPYGSPQRTKGVRAAEKNPRRGLGQMGC